MHFSEKMIEVRKELEKLGHEPFHTGIIDTFLGMPEHERDAQKKKDQMENDAIREFWNKMQNSDAVLVLNFDRHNIKNYIGGNTLMEIGFAHVLHQKIFLWNPIPEIPYYKMEIEAVRPVVINGNLSLIQ